MRNRAVHRAGLLAALLLAGWAGPAAAQMSAEEEQRCVWQCLYNSPGAESRQYQQCVARMCTGEPAPPAAAPRSAAPQAAPRQAAPAPRGTWQTGRGQAGEHFAAIEVPGGAFTYICRPGGVAMLGIGGIGGSGAQVVLQVDRQPYRLRYRARNGVLFVDAPAPQVIGGLMNGTTVQVADPQSGRRLSFPLAGSGAAIRTAMAGCGLRP